MEMQRHFELPPPNGGRTDRIVVIDDVSFDQFMKIARQRDAETRWGVRLHYLEGQLELMTTGLPHELISKTLARCLEAWAELAGIQLEGVGRWTMRKRVKKRGAEADECYYVGKVRAPREFPDLAIEVNWSRRGLNKLEIYRGLRVREVWIWQDRRINVFVLYRGKYRQRQRSKVLPGVDVGLFERCLNNSEGTQLKALAMLRAELKH
jgi:Uma2 family endonuclease